MALIDPSICKRRYSLSQQKTLRVGVPRAAVTRRDPGHVSTVAIFIGGFRPAADIYEKTELSGNITLHGSIVVGANPAVAYREICPGPPVTPKSAKESR